MKNTNKHATQFQKELKALTKEQRIHPKVMDAAPNAVYGETNLAAHGFHSLEELVTVYMETQHPARDAKSLAVDKSAFDLLLKYIAPETDIRIIQNRTLLAFRNEILMKIPARWRCYPEFRGASFSELVKDHGMPCLSPRTVNHICTILDMFFARCVEHKYIENNPAENLQPYPSESIVINESVRLPYSLRELEEMFYHLSPKSLPNWEPYKLFVPVLALYNGLRQSEACQLQVENIILGGEVPCIQIKADERTGCIVKKQSSTRTIPIHPVVLQLGFLKYVLNAGSGPLWPELKPDDVSKGYALRFGRSFDFFNRKFVTKEQKRNFSSLQQNFANALRQKDTPEGTIMQLTGRAEGNVSSADMLASLKGIDYGFDIFAQTGIEPLSECEIAGQIEDFFNHSF